jgi:protein-tyrosine phosphatase
MFNFFKKRKLVTDLSWLGVDIHSHILPGIDDGAKVIEESIDYITRMQNLGFEKLYFTPHIFAELYPNTREIIIPVLETVKAKLVSENNNIPIAAAAEYMVDYNFSIANDLLCLPDRHLLIEMSYLSETPDIEDKIFALQIKGYNIILAHPERYNFYHQNTAKYQRLKDLGCAFQLNLLSVLGYYGKHVKQAAEFLITHKLYDFAATDLHHEKHLSILEKEVRNGHLYSILGDYQFNNIKVFK